MSWADLPWLPRAGLATFSTLAAVVAAWRARGPLVGGIALLVFTVVGVLALAPRRVRGRWRRHPILDSSMVVPLTFLALAVVLFLSLWVCLVVALLSGGVMVPVSMRSRPRRPNREEPEGGI
jgi:hypothetical protein